MNISIPCNKRIAVTSCHTSCHKDPCNKRIAVTSCHKFDPNHQPAFRVKKFTGFEMTESTIPNQMLTSLSLIGVLKRRAFFI